MAKKPNIASFGVDSISRFETRGGGLEGLSKLVKQTVERAKREHIDFSSRRDHWIRLIEELFDTIEKSWLSGLIKSGGVRATRGRVDLIEEHIGEYEVPFLSLQIGDSVVKLVPKGTLVIGALGRVDMEGSGGKVMLVLNSDSDQHLPYEQKQFSWNIAFRDPTWKSLTLDKDNFSDAVSQILTP